MKSTAFAEKELKKKVTTQEGVNLISSVISIIIFMFYIFRIVNTWIFVLQYKESIINWTGPEFVMWQAIVRFMCNQLSLGYWCCFSKEISVQNICTTAWQVIYKIKLNVTARPSQKIVGSSFLQGGVMLSIIVFVGCADEVTWLFS